MTSTDSPVELTNVCKSFGQGSVKCTAIHDVSFRALPGELVLLLGPSGSGKTTLLSLIAGLVQPTGGNARLFGVDIRNYDTARLQCVRATRLGFVFQMFLLLEALTVLENVSLVLQFAGQGRLSAHRRSRELLAQLGIDHLEQKFPSQLSHGERQRVAIARAIANNPEVIIADEPTASLDSRRGMEVVHLLKSYATEHNACVIMASHDERIRSCAQRVLRLRDGRLVEDAGSI